MAWNAGRHAGSLRDHLVASGQGQPRPQADARTAAPRTGCVDSFDLPREKMLQHPWRELARDRLPDRCGWKYLPCVTNQASLGRCRASGLRPLRRPGAAARASRRSRSAPSMPTKTRALDTFRAAKAARHAARLRPPIAYWELGRRLMQEEAERLPAVGGDARRRHDRFATPSSSARSRNSSWPTSWSLPAASSPIRCRPGRRTRPAVMSPFGSPASRRQWLVQGRRIRRVRCACCSPARWASARDLPI